MKRARKIVQEELQHWLDNRQNHGDITPKAAVEIACRVVLSEIDQALAAKKSEDVCRCGHSKGDHHWHSQTGDGRAPCLVGLTREPIGEVCGCRHYVAAKGDK